MPPRGVMSSKRKRQYKRIKESGKARGMSEGRAEQMAARTVNKQRRQAGETKGRRRSSGSSRSRTSSGRASSTRSRSRRSTSRSSGRKKK